MRLSSWIYLNFKIATGSLCGFRLRTLLALFGVFLGTFSLIIVANLSKSLVKKPNLRQKDSARISLLSGVV